MPSLLRAFIENEAAIRRVLSRYFSRPQDIEDIAQETFLHAFAAANRFEIRAPRAYLIRIAKNLALNELARKSNATTDYLEDSDVQPVLRDERQAPPDELLESRQELAVVARSIARLPPMCRRVFVMRKIEQLTFQEISTKLGISISTAEKHVALGLVRCADSLRRQGYQSDDPPTRRGVRPAATGGKHQVVALRDARQHGVIEPDSDE